MNELAVVREDISRTALVLRSLTAASDSDCMLAMAQEWERQRDRLLDLLAEERRIMCGEERSVASGYTFDYACTTCASFLPCEHRTASLVDYQRGFNAGRASAEQFKLEA